MTKSARKKAVTMLMSIEKDSAYVNIEMNKLRQSKDFTALDMRFIGEILNGVIRHKLTIDHVIALHSQTKLQKISPYILAVLRSGVYQILYMDKIPSSAAVNESVNLVKKSSVSRLSGYVNAVLRKVKPEDIIFDESEDAGKIALKHSFPKWIIKRWVNDFGFEFAQRLAASLNEHPPLFIRCNRLKCDINELKSILDDEQIEYEDFRIKGFDGFKTCLKIKSPKSLLNTEAFSNGYFYVQDPAAAVAAYVVSPLPGETVIDMCSAPGGKSLFMAELMENKGCIHSFDIYEHKIKLIESNAKKYGATIINAKISDATQYNPELCESADRILCDVPCSGLGIIRKKPDIKYSHTDSDVSKLSELSLKILDNASNYLKPGGTLVLSTCTVDKRENEDVCERFLSSHSEFARAGFGDDGLGENGYKTFYPHIDGTDGFFVAKFVKRSNSND